MDKKEFLISKGVDAETAIENMMGMDIYDEMIHDYMESLPNDFNTLINYKNTGDIANYAIQVHAMKSNARSFGFMKLGEIAYAHEMKSKENDVAFINEHFGELESAVNEVEAILEEYKNL